MKTITLLGTGFIFIIPGRDMQAEVLYEYGSRNIRSLGLCKKEVAVVHIYNTFRKLFLNSNHQKYEGDIDPSLPLQANGF